MPINHMLRARTEEAGVHWWHWITVDGPLVKHVDTIRGPTPDWDWYTLPERNGSERKPCEGCKKWTERKWLGIRWMGTPFPKRLRLRRHWWPIYVKKDKGCGCIVKLKALKIALVSGARYVWNA